MKTCQVTTWNPHSTGPAFRWGVTRCNLPTVRRGLCERYYADRVRLGGRP